MEDQEAARADDVAAPPFSELIRDWLDEGDRLDETATATIAEESPRVERPFQRIARRLRPVLDRYRVVVLASVGLIPLFLFTLTHHAPAAPALAVATVSNVPTPLPTRPPVLEAAAVRPPVAPPSTGRGASRAATAPTLAYKSRHRSGHRLKHRPVASRAR